MTPPGRLLQATGLVLAGLVVARGALMAPASDCTRRSLLEGGDQIPGFCVDFGEPFAIYGLLAALAAIIAGICLAWWTFGLVRGGVWRLPLRVLLLAMVIGGIIAYAAWTHGSGVQCVTVSGGSMADACWREDAAWQPWAYFSGGFLSGIGAAGFLGLALFERARSRGADPPARP